MSLCVTCPHSSAGMEAGGQVGAGWGRERKRAVPRLCFLNCLEQQEAEGDRQVTGPAKVTHPPQPCAAWREPHVCLLYPHSVLECSQIDGRVRVIPVPSPSLSRSMLGTEGHPQAREEGQDEVAG